MAAVEDKKFYWAVKNEDMRDGSITLAVLYEPEEFDFEEQGYDEHGLFSGKVSFVNIPVFKNNAYVMGEEQKDGEFLANISQEADTDEPRLQFAICDETKDLYIMPYSEATYLIFDAGGENKFEAMGYSESGYAMRINNELVLE